MKSRISPSLSLAQSALPRAFATPAYWVALAVLIANDHLLKGAGVLPAWLTGKLSDFAGLVVAPPLLALLLGWAFPKRERAVSIASAALVGLGLAAIKLHPGSARFTEALFSAMGFGHATIQLDPTDLMALVVLPWAAALCRKSNEIAVARAADRLGAHVGTRIGIAIASFACIATIGDDDKAAVQTDMPSLLNASEETLVVHIASTDGAGGCRIYREDRIGVLTPDAYGLRREIVLAPNATTTLGTGEGDATCGAAWIALADGSEERVYWRDLAAIEEFLPDDDAQRIARRVILRGESNRFRFEIGDDLNRIETSDEPIGSTCSESVPDYTLEASALALAPGFYEVGEITHDADDCMLVEWFAQSGDAAPDTQRLCIPTWGFPFEEGEALSISELQLESGERRLRFTRYVDGTAIDQQVTIWNNATELAESHVAKLVAADCIGTLAECGAYVRPIEIELPGDEGVILSGDEADLSDRAGEIRMIVGSGRDVGWSAATCTGDETRLGPTVNVLELRTN